MLYARFDSILSVKLNLWTLYCHVSTLGLAISVVGENLIAVAFGAQLCSGLPGYFSGKWPVIVITS